MSKGANRGFDTRNNSGPDRVQYRQQPYGHEAYSIGYYAHKLRIRPSTLVSLFKKAGIQGVTPSHVISLSEREALNAYIKSIRESKTKEIYRDSSPAGSGLIVLQDINARLLQELARKPQLVHDLDPRKFEELVAKLLEDQGCDVTLTRRTRDGGYDLLAACRT